MTSAAIPAPPQPKLPENPRTPGRRSRSLPYYLILPIAVWLALFFIIPFVSLVATSLYDPEGSVLTGYDMTWHFANFGHVISTYGSHLWRSVWWALIATAFCLVFGYILAYTIAFKTGRWKNVALVLVIAPFFTSFLIRTNAWKLILGDQSWLVHTLQSLHILGADDRILATPVAAIAGLTYNYMPFAILPLYTSIEKIDQRLVEAAGDLYANASKTFLRVTLPLTLPGVISATLLTFIPAVGDYINAQLLGSTADRVIGSDIQSLFTSTQDYASAGALSVLLLLIILVSTLVYVRRFGTEEIL
ncbi:ABC transporter permease [Nocardioides sp. Kera G14]|uniref:ABC transporter permease n=1 Tax=Nocardioides sp. Kera G14 TaxID=2884264 RepID=UPI001D126C49|nr:ABC transporter permease [Nocardioides sp. Kera G14]UDY22604.1 ABC transporter permease [Nocardioides sp. Kera G14]